MGEDREQIMSDVIRVELADNGVRMYDIMGNERILEGVRLNHADLMAHEIILERI
jgi:predicted RNA-binding protein